MLVVKNDYFAFLFVFALLGINNSAHAQSAVDWDDYIDTIVDPIFIRTGNIDGQIDVLARLTSTLPAGYRFDEMSLSGPDYSAAPLGVSQLLKNNAATEWSVSLSTYVEYIDVYASYWRGSSTTLDDAPAEYHFNRPFTIASGFDGAVVQGATLILDDDIALSFHGILRFPGPLDSVALSDVPLNRTYFPDGSYYNTPGGTQLFTVATGPIKKPEVIVLHFSENVPFLLEEKSRLPFGMWRYWEVDSNGSMPGSTLLPTSQTEVIEEVRAIFNRSGINNIIVTTTPPASGDYINVYFSNIDVGGINGKALTENSRPDRFNKIPGGDVVINTYSFEHTTNSRIAETIAHEVGHLWGLIHIDPILENSIMDFDFTNVSQFSGSQPYFNDEFLTTHNPAYHIKRYVEGLDPSLITEEPGLWDVGLAEYLMIKLSSDSNQTLYNAGFYVGGGGWASSDGYSDYELIHYFGDVTLSELSVYEFSLVFGTQVQLIGSSVPGGELDTVLSYGDPLDISSVDIRVGIFGDVFLQTETEAGYSTLGALKIGVVGDLNSDNYVGIEDLNIVLEYWNQIVTVGEELYGDPSGDGFVGIEDLNIILSNWNNGFPPLTNANIPEPGSIGLLLTGSIMLRKRAS